ncbi:hypothetical protein J8V57_05925 [Xenorhabdus sp. PB61.4]|uniref:hypothetical protein n=1 Tax=Xenorhabdus sp. PB61.4 TaxID=2788940 RepID=UPI001E550CB6|nr:hypothetical protein [Xenorhabdus sp. PB61.4]MCC8365822.1 hypothetical protein [Xenorhabdus sp. PB61.4]
MNAKSKIFLALALVLSVTACSKGGGSHHNFSTDITKTIPVEVTEKPGITNTYISYQAGAAPGAPQGQSDDRITRFLGNNKVWFAASGDYISRMGNEYTGWDQNKKYNQSQYKFIQFGPGGDTASIIKDPDTPNHSLFRNKDGNASVGQAGDKIFLATPWEYVSNTTWRQYANAGKHDSYSGPVVFQEKMGKIRNDLTMTLNAKYTIPTTGVIPVASVNSQILLNNQPVATLQNGEYSGGSTIYTNAAAKFTGISGFDFLSGKTMVWGYTDKDASGISGIIGSPDSDGEFGAFVLSK